MVAPDSPKSQCLRRKLTVKSRYAHMNADKVYSQMRDREKCFLNVNGFVFTVNCRSGIHTSVCAC